MRKNGVLTYLHSDHLGSPVLTTNASASATQTYNAYGKVRTYSGSFPTRYQFTGQYTDNSSLVYMNARYYDPQIGLFVSPDTIVPDAGRVSDYNRSMYARGNPLKYNDPSGHAGIIGQCQCSGGDAQAYMFSGGGGVNIAQAAGTAGNIGVTGAMVLIATADALNSNQDQTVTPIASPSPALTDPLPAPQPATRTWLPLSDGMDMSVPGTSDSGSGTVQLPGFNVIQPNPGDNVYTSQLSDNMTRAGVARPAGTAAHHIVAQNDPRAAGAQAILAGAGIGVNDAANGVYLPANLSYPTVGGATHSIIHTRIYYQEVESRLLNRGNASVQSVLRQIASELEQGLFPH